MATISFDIVSGAAPFVAKIVPSLIPQKTINAVGTYQFLNVPNGVYTLSIKDSNECEFEQQLNLNPLVTTTTTTIAPGDSIVVGNTQDIGLIFDIAGTNRDNQYNGYPVATQTELYLWLKTSDGKPLTTQKSINYNIGSTISASTSTFKFVGVSDEIHTEVIKTVLGPNKLIAGQIILKTGFIETYFKYTYYLDLTKPDFQIDLSSINEWTLVDIPLVDTINIYGVTYIDRNNIIMNF